MRLREADPRVERIRAWSSQGKTFAWIADQLGVSRQRISQIARKHGIKPAFDAEALHLRGKAVAAWLRAHPEVRSGNRHDDFDTRLGAIKWGAAAGKTYDQVAALLGVSRNVIAGMAHRNGIKFGGAA